MRLFLSLAAWPLGGFFAMMTIPVGVLTGQTIASKAKTPGSGLICVAVKNLKPAAVCNARVSRAELELRSLPEAGVT